MTLIWYAPTTLRHFHMGDWFIMILQDCSAYTHTYVRGKSLCMTVCVCVYVHIHRLMWVMDTAVLWCNGSVEKSQKGSDDMVLPLPHIQVCPISEQSERGGGHCSIPFAELHKSQTTLWRDYAVMKKQLP